ncbi:uncharacterized protein LOC141658997 [Silene latifolia]|uniref:uncharacterized protein LOC141658997 n=1 Tax=Silene latifolia TaxID=37657 RepID=UPI003D76FE6B
MGKKKMATRTTPKKATTTTVEDVPARARATTGRKKVVIEEEPEEEMEMEQDAVKNKEKVGVRKRGRPKANFGKRKGVVIEEEVSESDIEESESEELEPPPKVSLKKAKGKGGTNQEPKPLQSVTPTFEVGEASTKVKGKMIVRLKKPVEDEMEVDNSDVNRVVTKEKVVEGHGNPRALYELIEMLTPAQKKKRRGYRVWGAFGVESKCFLSSNGGLVDGVL